MCFPKNSIVLYCYVFICVGEYLATIANNSTLFYLQKLEERKTMLAKWCKVMVMLMMSSEESGEDDGEEVLIRCRLSWRAERVNDFFKSWMIMYRQRSPPKPDAK